MTKEEAKERCCNHVPATILDGCVATKVMVVGVSNTSEEALVSFPFSLGEEEIKFEWVSLKYLI